MNESMVSNYIESIKRPRIKLLYNLLLASVFCLPLEGFYIEVGGTYRLSSTIAIFATLVLLFDFDVVARNNSLQAAYSKSFRYILKVLIAFYLVTLTSNLIFLLFEKIDPSVIRFFDKRFGDSAMAIFRTYLKPVQAIFSQSFSYSWFLISIVAIHTKRDLLRISWAYVISTTIQDVLGIVQLLIFTATGNDLFPINRGGLIAEDSYTQTATLKTSLGYALRITGLSGEPGALALYSCFAMAITLLLLLPHVTRKSHKSFCFICLGLQLVGTLLTYSTRGYLLISLLVFIYFITSDKKVFIIPLAPLILGFAYYLVGGIPDYVEDIFSTRILARLGFDDFDLVYLEVLKKTPSYWFIGCGFGNVHLLMEPFSRYMVPFEIGNIAPKSGLFFIISTSGILGFSILCMLPLRIISRINYALRSGMLNSSSFLIGVRNVVAYMSISGIILQFNVFAFFWVSAGFAALEAYINQVNTQLKFYPIENTVTQSNKF
jgi:hypothetical protein